MKQLTVVSGKGGTGKTSVTASLAALASARAPVVMADCDVDAANLGLVMPGEDLSEEPVFAGRRAQIDPSLCVECFQCVDTCRFKAIAPAPGGGMAVAPLSCEGCGVCALVCAFEAVELVAKPTGSWSVRRTEKGPLVHARLALAQDNSGKLVALVRQRAREMAEADGHELILIDGPPGIGCPAHAALTGCDLVLAVAEPTAAGVHDLERLLELCRSFELTVAVTINKHQLSPARCEQIVELAQAAGAEVLGTIPFDPEVPRALARGELPLVVPPVRAALEALWGALSRRLGLGPLALSAGPGPAAFGL